MERHYTAKEVAGIFGISDDMARRIFANEPGVLDFAIPNKQSKSRGRNRLSKQDKSQANNLSEWDKTIADTKKRIDRLKRVIEVCQEKKAAGEPWPGTSPRKRVYEKRVISNAITALDREFRKIQERYPTGKP